MAATVFIVDNDSTSGDALRRLIESRGHRVVSHATAESFLAACDPQQPGCVVLDVRLPGMSGLELQDELKRRAIALPVIFVTGHGNVPTAVSAVKKGAYEFIEKPYDELALLGLVEDALRLDAAQRREQARRVSVAARVATLTQREREIMQHVIAGKMNKTIADDLCISIKTVEAHRAKVMKKIGVDSVAELVQLTLESGHARVRR
jgi:FixJ family two-component response regulator